MTTALLEKLSQQKELRRILEITVSELSKSLNSNCCQILLANPFDPNSAMICEGFAHSDTAKPEQQHDWPRLTLPLVLNGRSFGSLTLVRSTPWLASEIDSTHLLIGKLSDLIRQAQLSDILQRETFRENFLIEINNLMAYSLGIGDALFMVVNILGKALRASRCLFVCTDDKTVGWKCYEFWQQDKVKSCQEYHWPTNDSSLIAQTLQAQSPLKFYEGQENSYLTPAQAELQFSGSRSLLAMPLLHENNVYGCVIIQQCDYRRDWTRDEIDMVQQAADRVALALANLPEEKRIHKPIMQLHQRIIAPEGQTAASTGAALIQSLKGAFGQKSIPSAVETLQELPALGGSALHVSLEHGQAEAEAQTTATTPTPSSHAASDPVASAAAASASVSPDQPLPQPPTIKPAKSASLGSKLAEMKKKAGRTEYVPPSVDAVVTAPNIVPVKAKEKTKAEPAAPLQPAWGDLDAIPTPSSGPAMSGLGASMLPKLKAQTAAAGSQLRASLHKDRSEGATADLAGPASNADVETGELGAATTQGSLVETGELGVTTAQGSLVETGALGATTTQSSLVETGELGVTTTPGSLVETGELGVTTTPSAHVAANESGAVAAPGAEAAVDSAAIATPGVDVAAGQLSAEAAGDSHSTTDKIPAAVETEEEAKEKIERALAAHDQYKETSDYIFAIKDMDPRVLGRIAGWVEEIEKKDKYLTPHAKSVAEYACGIAQELKLSPGQIDNIRIAALLHDVGKLGTAAEILQKRDDDLDDAELLTIMRHPLDGAELLQSIPDLASFAEIVLAHHEEYNGNGFPQGLKGEEIPLAARIIFVANSYHSLISNKRYGKGMSNKEAQKQLQQGADNQYDPAVVEAFLKWLQKKQR